MLDVDLWQQRFIEYLTLRGFSPRTVQGYRYEVRPFLEYLEGSGIQSLAAITRELVEGYRVVLAEASYRGRALTLVTQSHRLVATKSFLRFLWRERYMLIDVSAAVDLPRVPKLLPKVLLSEDEVCQLLEGVSIEPPLGLRNRAMLELFYATAMRNSELRALQLADIDIARREVRIHLGKGQKSRVVPLGEVAEDWVTRYVELERPHLVARPQQKTLFLTYSGKDFHCGDLALLVRALSEGTGLEKKVTPHVLRHSCATHMLARGASLRHIQQLLGHASLESTQRYTQLEMTDLRRVLAQCHPRERGWQ